MAKIAETLPLTGVELTFTDDEVIVSRTDIKGRLTYCNRAFMRLAGYSEKDLLGKQHSIVRHPDMPRCIFKLLWDTISSGKEIFAYVLNRSANGDHYWVFAHVTPTFDEAGHIVGYNSTRRNPDGSAIPEAGNVIGYNSARRNPHRGAIAKVEALYKILLDEENKYPNTKEGMMAGYNLLLKILARPFA